MDKRWTLAGVVVLLYAAVSLWVLFGGHLGPGPDLLMTMATMRAADGAPGATASKEPSGTVVVGYFHGGRTAPLFRAAVAGRFKDQGLKVVMRTHNLGEDRYYEVSADPEGFRRQREEADGREHSFGKATGEELIDEMLAGRSDGACVGESSFIDAVADGDPVVAVMALAHDTREKPGHAICLRKGLTLKSPAELKGLHLVARRAGPGDEVFLREFLTQNGLDPDKDVKLSVDVDDDAIVRDFDKFDGGFYHLISLRQPVKAGDAYVYRRFDWVDPSLSTSLLVFPRTYVEQHRDEIQRLVTAITTQILAESLLTPEERLASNDKGFRMEMDFQGMNLPQADLPPQIHLDLLDKMQDLMVKHHALKAKLDLRPFVDLSFGEKVAERLPEIRDNLSRAQKTSVTTFRRKPHQQGSGN